MATNNIYMDACCLIEAIKGKLGVGSSHDLAEVSVIQRALRAGRNGDLNIYTSMLSVSEVLYVDKDEKPPSDEVKRMIERFMLSGRDGVMLVSIVPNTALRARDLAWEYGIYTRSIDTMHIASAVQCGAKELYTLDGRLAKKLKKDSVDGCRLISPLETSLLPDAYRTDDLFE